MDSKSAKVMAIFAKVFTRSGDSATDPEEAAHFHDLAGRARLIAEAAHASTLDDSRSQPFGETDVQQVQGLFHSALNAKTPEALVEFAQFCAKFRRFSIFNVRLIQTQRPGAHACATESEWQAAGRWVLADARPIIILRPFGPVALVYDLEDSGPVHDREAIGDPFAATSALSDSYVQAAIEKLTAGCKSEKMFRIFIKADRLGFGMAGSAAKQGSLPLLLPDDAAAAAHTRVKTSKLDRAALPGKRAKVVRFIPCWRIKANDRMTAPEQFVTLVHELGHIFCGHLGSCEGLSGRGGWADRRELNYHEKEMEAEAVAWLVAQRVGIMSRSPAYLKRHIENGDVRKVDTDVVVRAASRIEALAQLRYPTSNLRSTPSLQEP